MNPTDFIAKVRLVLDDVVDPALNPVPTYTDAEIVEHGWSQSRHLARIQTQRAKGFYNFTMVLRGSSTESIPMRQVANSVWQWALPSWIMQVAGVWQIASSLQKALTNFSPATWSSVSTDLPVPGLELPRWNRSRSTGYTWDDRRHLREYGFATAPDLILNVAKLPSRWFRAQIDFQHADTDKFYLPTTAFALGAEDILEGAYINADIQIVSGSAAELTGQVRRCVYSAAANKVTATRRHLIWLDSPWPGGLGVLPVGVTLETLLPIADEHSRVLELLVANACFEKKGNLPGQRSIAPEMLGQLKDFNEYASDQDTIKGPMFWHSPESVGGTYDPDRHPQFRPTY